MVDAGDRVEQDSVLVTLDDELARLNLERAVAEKTQARIALEDSKRLFLGNAGVGDAVQPRGFEFLLILRAQVAPIRDAPVMLVGDQVENVFFQVRPRAGDRVDLVPPDHLRQGTAQFGRGHGPGDWHAGG